MDDEVTIGKHYLLTTVHIGKERIMPADHIKLPLHKRLYKKVKNYVGNTCLRLWYR